MPMTDTVTALLERHLAERPDDVAFLEGDRRITYREFAALCGKTAAWLVDQGVAPGDRVAVLAGEPDRVAGPPVRPGADRSVPGGASTRAIAPPRLQTVLDRSGARHARAPAQLPQDRLPRRAGRASTPARCRGARMRVAVVDCDASDALADPRSAHDRLQAFARDAGERARCARVRHRAGRASFTTSGTTKGPKLVMHSQRTIAFHSAPGGGSLRVRRARRVPARGDTVLRRIRLQQRAWPPFAAGAPVVLMDTFEAGPAVASRPAAPRHARLRQRRDVSPDARAGCRGTIRFRASGCSASPRSIPAPRNSLARPGTARVPLRRPLRLERSAGALLGAVAVGPVPAADRGRRAARGGK